MKRLLIILGLAFTLSLAGMLYGTQNHSDEGKTIITEYTFMDQYPEQMPDMVLDPMAGLLLY